MSIKFQFLGTCAADFSPKLKTDFVDCFDMNARRSSAAIINGRYLIDCGVHTIESLRIAGIPLENITDVFFTHLHGDHFQKANLAKIAEAKSEPLRVWVANSAKMPKIENTVIIRMPKFAKIDVDNGVYVTGLPANHDEGAAPQYLLFEVDGKSILYATDGAWILNSTYYHLKNANLDMLVLDCTCGDYEGEYRIGEHNNIPMIRLMMPSFRKWGIVNDNTSTYITHLAPSLHKPHSETVEIMKPMGVKVAYDGLEIEM
jgi:phosphoribosyl 1,2-cyclic phosphate phosphodiesterase